MEKKLTKIELMHIDEVVLKITHFIIYCNKANCNNIVLRYFSFSIFFNYDYLLLKKIKNQKSIYSLFSVTLTHYMNIN